uniref:Essential MCU regulator, mitochondrial n=2 Tax=Trichobilharzia regenti TaxID=157069 RepID=A0AA85K7T1_TRIRE|nr:unnamed protein product [Trichobilharzia regenti]CAH8843107.1 unnamed protein product [Trichobilharzia regenti]
MMITTRRLLKYIHLKKLCSRGIQCYSGEAGSCSSTGAFHPRPIMTPLGLIKVVGAVLPSIYLGSFISRSGAEFLEENDIFVPEDD